MRGLASVALCLALVSCAQEPPLQSDWERAHQEQNRQEDTVALPPYPERANLVEFEVDAGPDFHFLVDATSLSVGSDGIVHYVLVARSPEGVENDSFEGLRCRDGEYKIYATGRSDRTWSKARDPRWRPVEQSAGSWHRTLADDFFCPQRTPIRTAAEGVDALRQGRNPRADSHLQGP